MNAEMPGADIAGGELDHCIDELLATGDWEVRIAHGTERQEIDSLMNVAELLRALTRHIARPRPNQKSRGWVRISDSLHDLSATFAPNRDSMTFPCTRSAFG